MTMFRSPRSPGPDDVTPASCRAITRIVESYLDGECDSETAQRVVAHLEVCTRCADETRSLEEIKRTLVTGRCCGSDPQAVANLRAYVKHLSQG